MKECFYCHSAPEMKWVECMNFGHKALGYYVACPCGCMLCGVKETPTEAQEVWDERIRQLPIVKAREAKREAIIRREAIADGWRFWHITGPDGWEFDLWLKRQSDLITQDMRIIYTQRGYDRIDMADFTFADMTEGVRA